MKSRESDSRRLFNATNGRRRGADYIWLAYSVFFFIEPVLRKSVAYWIECLGIFLVFLSMYVVFVEVKQPQLRKWMVAGIVALGLATLHFNGGASSLLIFAAALIPFTVESVGWALGLMIAESMCVVAEWLWMHGNAINIAITATILIVVGVANVFVAEQRRADCKLRAAQEENLALAAVAERERIARDLHDVLGHTLSVIVLKAELARRLMGVDDERAGREIGEVEETARAALAEVRETIVGFRSKGLVAEVEQARRTLDAAGVALECCSRPPAMGATAESVLSLAVREAVTNIVRHAGATRCTMRFAATGDGFDAMVVEDDGRGAGVGEGNGLRGMRERVQALGGRFRVESGAGTRVIVELPQVTR